MISNVRFLQATTINLTDRLQSSITSHQKRILIIASLALSCLAALYLLAKNYFESQKKKAHLEAQVLSNNSSQKKCNHQPILKEGENPSIENPNEAAHPILEIDPTSTLIFHQQTKKYVYISPAPPIKNLVISGGGAKGVVLPGVIKAFEEHTVGDTTFKEELDHVAGSSVGAMTATFIAIGVPVNDLIAATTKEDFKALLGKGYGPIFKDGKPLLDFIRTQIQATLSKHLMDMCNVAKLEDITDVQALVGDQLAKRNKAYGDDEVDALIVQMENIIAILQKQDIDNVCITFSMLQTLRELNPTIFKDLTVTATCRENGQCYYFDASRTPDLDIAVACRASASLPIILNPVKIEPNLLLPGYVHSQAMSFVDGGYFDNIPVQIVEKKQGENNKRNAGDHGQNLQTLVLIFDGTGRKGHEQSPFHDEVTKPSMFETSNVVNRLFRDHIPRMVVGINTTERHTVSKEKGMHEIRVKYTQRNIPLLVSLDTIDFAKAKRDQHAYINSGYEQAKEYLMNHQDELMYRTFESLDELVDYLPEEHVNEHWDRIVAFSEQCSK